MNFKTLFAPALIATALGLSACGGGDDSETATVTEPATETSAEPSGSAPAPSGEAARAEKVEIADFAYDPDPVTVQVGGKVTWLNQDSAPHTATADDGSFDTGTLEEGKLGSESFKQAGTYGYFCEIHPDMRGTVEVIEKD
ncbi:MAG TPA: cupredoxin family copper-binding protein [Solirubrobacterales bacterium]|nr:cupredoxin family copper-binding protein [Solirubrobacterales bacterium]